jgi:hypothetical protein
MEELTMSGRTHPLRVGEIGKKKLTPKRKKKGKEEGVKVVRGDVIILRGGFGHSSIGVVTEVAHAGGPHRLVDERGHDREVYKPAADGQRRIFASDAYEGKIVVVGHDDEWLRFEEGISDRRREFSRTHQNAAWRHIVESKSEEK